MPGLRLTNNEKTVLKKLIDSGRVSDSQMSDEMKISQQAVNQIRNRLEELGVIKGYMPIIDFEKIGLRLFNFVGIQIKPELWERLTEGELQHWLILSTIYYRKILFKHLLNTL